MTTINSTDIPNNRGHTEKKKMNSHQYIETLKNILFVISMILPFYMLNIFSFVFNKANLYFLLDHEKCKMFDVVCFKDLEEQMKYSIRYDLIIFILNTIIFGFVIYLLGKIKMAVQMTEKEVRKDIKISVEDECDQHSKTE